MQLYNGTTDKQNCEAVAHTQLLMNRVVDYTVHGNDLCWQQQQAVFQHYEIYTRGNRSLTFHDVIPGIHFSPGRSAEASASSKAPAREDMQISKGYSIEHLMQFQMSIATLVTICYKL